MTDNFADFRTRITFSTSKGTSYFAQARETIRSLFDAAPFNGILTLQLEYVNGRLINADSKTKWTDDAAQAAIKAVEGGATV